ncbi:MAG: glycosyltransferase [Bacteroidetes bacterium]|nr:glycosyltransferase [Bacteroidota bacterium]
MRNKVCITVFFAGSENEGDKKNLYENFPEIKVEFASENGILTYKECKEKFEKYIKEKFFDIAIVEYIELSIVLEYLPDKTMTILDTHDLVHNRVKSFKKYKLEYKNILLSRKEELKIFKCYDYVMLIQKSDFENIAEEIGVTMLLLVPHPVMLSKKFIRKVLKNVGFIASPYAPNIDALNWFIHKVWEKIYSKYDLVLNVYGNIKYAIGNQRDMHSKKIIFHGLVHDLEGVYKYLDIIINPIRCGAGLKIKSIEALGHGLPLITTTHGASGIEDGASIAFLIADTPEEFVEAFDNLIYNFEHRKKIAGEAFKYAQTNFSKKKCYGDLLRVIT